MPEIVAEMPDPSSRGLDWKSFRDGLPRLIRWEEIPGNPANVPHNARQCARRYGMRVTACQRMEGWYVQFLPVDGDSAE